MVKWYDDFLEGCSKRAIAAFPNDTQYDPTGMVQVQRRRASSRRGSIFLLFVCCIIIIIVLQSSISDEDTTTIFHTKVNRPIIGTWNTLPLYEVKHHPLHSSASCMFQHDNDWKYNSCRYENLCWDIASEKYVVFDTVPPVSIGGLNPRWGKDAVKMRWTPQVISADNNTIAMLDSDILLIPFHSMAAHNIGHLLWDDLYNIYSLRNALDDTTQYKWFLIRQSLNETLYANCDIRRNKRLLCRDNFARILPFFNDIMSSTFSSTNQMTIRAPTQIVCAKHALSGFGYWTDHGDYDHGWDGPQVPHNLARGVSLYEFGQFLMSKHHHHKQQTAQWITISLESSRDVSRRLDFATQRTALSDLPFVRSVRLRDLSIEEQMDVGTSTHIFITACGGGAMTVTFLPKDTSVIVFYDDTGGLEFPSLHKTHQPARLDWDLLNNASHLRVHWLPIHRMNEKAYVQLFRAIVLHERALMERTQTK